VLLEMNSVRQTVTIIAVFCFILSFSTVFAAEKQWSRSKILDIADGEAQRLGYDIEHMSISFDIYNSKWSKYLHSMKELNALPKIQDKLKDRKFWAVYYAPLRKHVRGGDLWVFIDQDSGMIITTIRGE
jgi:hypothetical protein